MAQNVNDAVSIIQSYTGAGVDGMWGTQTSEYFTETIRVMQAELGLEPDGWLGPNTIGAMREAMEAGTLNTEFGEAVIALYEGETVDHNGNSVSLSQLHSSRGHDMHDAAMVQDPETGAWSVEGGHNAMDMAALMPEPEPEPEPEAEPDPEPELELELGPQPAPEAPQPDITDGVEVDMIAPDAETAPDMEVFADADPRTVLPEMPEAAAANPASLPEGFNTASGGPPPEPVPETEIVPMPEDGAFNFTTGTNGAHETIMAMFTDDRYGSLNQTEAEALLMADYMYDAADRDGNITLEEAVDEYHGMTRFTQDHGELMERATAYGQDGTQTIFNVEDPAQMRALINVMAGVATGTIDPDNVPTELSNALDWIEENYDTVIINPGDFVPVPGLGETLIATNEAILDLNEIAPESYDAVQALTGIQQMFESHNSPDDIADTLQTAYGLVSDGIESLETISEYDLSEAQRQTLTDLQEIKADIERIAEDGNIDLTEPDTAPEPGPEPESAPEHLTANATDPIPTLGS